MAEGRYTFSIMGGRYKGKRLQMPATSGTRPTKSIIRGSLFDTLQNSIIDTLFVEVFGGSGSVGLEALSRGARKVWFLEREREALRTLEQNCALLDARRTELLRGDSFSLYPSLMQRLAEEGQAAFIYLDPPFSIREGMEDIYKKMIRLIETTPPEAVLKIIVEHMSKLSLPEAIGPYRRGKSKKFGKSALTYYEVV